jgi:hypothetical protein
MTLCCWFRVSKCQEQLHLPSLLFDAHLQLNTNVALSYLGDFVQVDLKSTNSIIFVTCSYSVFPVCFLASASLLCFRVFFLLRPLLVWIPYCGC